MIADVEEPPGSLYFGEFVRGFLKRRRISDDFKYENQLVVVCSPLALATSSCQPDGRTRRSIEMSDKKIGMDCDAGDRSFFFSAARPTNVKLAT